MLERHTVELILDASQVVELPLADFVDVAQLACFLLKLCLLICTVDRLTDIATAAGALEV